MLVCINNSSNKGGRAKEGELVCINNSSTKEGGC